MLTVASLESLLKRYWNFGVLFISNKTHSSAYLVFKAQFTTSPPSGEFLSFLLGTLAALHLLSPPSIFPRGLGLFHKN